MGGPSHCHDAVFRGYSRLATKMFWQRRRKSDAVDFLQKEDPFRLALAELVRQPYRSLAPAFWQSFKLPAMLEPFGQSVFPAAPMVFAESRNHLCLLCQAIDVLVV